MTDLEQQPRHLTDDLELAVEDATKAVGGDTKPAATQKPAEPLVFKFQDPLITSLTWT